MTRRALAGALFASFVLLGGCASLQPGIRDFERIPANEASRAGFAPERQSDASDETDATPRTFDRD